MLDRFATMTPSLTSPAAHGFAITPDDAAPLNEVTRAIYVGGAGDLALEMADGAVLSFTGLTAGSWLPLRARAVYASGTTATGLIGLS